MNRGLIPCRLLKHIWQQECSWIVGVGQVSHFTSGPEKDFLIRLTEIAIQFKQVPLALFKNKNIAFDAPNRLVLHIQPDEGITLSFGAKYPGLG